MERKKLLIADDSEMNRAILANMLEQPYKNISERTIAETAKSTASTNV